jgi:nicotinamide-nucleotide amidase
MFVEIITIGDEILIGQTIDTNSAWLGKELNDRGLDIRYVTSISDTKEDIMGAIDLAFSRSDVILMTGGLGPTKDDITRDTLTEYFQTRLILNEAVLENIQSHFDRVGRTLNEINRLQAMIPEACIPIPNSRGTAAGMVFEKNGKMLVSMPGVPYEMKSMMNNHVFELISHQYPQKLNIVHRTLSVIGIPESIIATQISHIEDTLPKELHLAYLPHLNIVRIRLTGKSSDISENELNHLMNPFIKQINDILGLNAYEGEIPIAKLVGELLFERKLNIGTVESCTGGQIANQIVGVSGSSRYFYGSLLTYDYSAKEKILDISREDLLKYGAVSEEIARQMVVNGKEKLGTDICISTTGIAGPGGGSNEKPVGLVYIGILFPNNKVIVHREIFPGSRDQIIEKVGNMALSLLRIHLLDFK